MGSGFPEIGAGPDPSSVALRKNLNETAFFFPHLVSDAEGGRPHGVHHARGTHQVEVPRLRPRQGAAQRLSRPTKVVTAKDLMIQPNPPRFLREGDVIEFTVKVSNRSATAPERQGPADISTMPARSSRSTTSIGNLRTPIRSSTAGQRIAKPFPGG